MKHAWLLVAAMATVLSTSADAAKKNAPKFVAGVFDYYVLSLSSAPQFCKSHPDDRSAECNPHPGGFVLHGLWPQYAQGGWPESCKFDAQHRSVPSLDAEGEAVGVTAFPTKKLMGHEWSKHGTCSGMTPTKYFHAADDAHKAVSIPTLLQPGPKTRSMALSNVTQAIIDANPKMTRSGLALVCVKGELSEVRACLDKDLQATACGKGVASGCGQTVKLLNVQ